MPNTKLNIVLLTTVLLMGSGCSSFFVPYKVNIRQGNIINQERVNQLRSGMTKRQVQYLMGTPLITDTFNQSRWNYISSLQRDDGIREQTSISLFFEEGKLSYFDGDLIPERSLIEITKPDE